MSPVRPKVGASMPAAKSDSKTVTDKKLELLFEVGCEEIPAGMLARATEELRSGLGKQLAVENIGDGVAFRSSACCRDQFVRCDGRGGQHAKAPRAVGARPAVAADRCYDRGYGSAEVGCV